MATELIIIGGGTAGLGAARAARVLGAKPTLVSDGPIGGDCTFTGCVPSKTLIAESRKGTPFGEAMARLHRVVDHIAATETADVLRAEGIEVITGRATLVAPGSVDVDGTSIDADRIVLATGARPTIPPIEGLSTVNYLTTETLWELTELPRRLGIIGAGPIGAEMAMAFAGFGSAVTLIDGADRVLPMEEPEASQVIEEVMTRSGIRVLTGAFATSVSQDPKGAQPSQGGGIRIVLPTEVVDVDTVLIAAGRQANTSGLGLADLGIELSKHGHITVDDKLRTSVKGVWAAGDVTGLLPFTHAADEQGRMAVAHALGKGPRWRYDASTTPWVTFTDPEVARVGQTEAQAAHHGGRVAYLPLCEVDRAITEDRTDGFVKLIAGPKPLTRNLFGGRIVGATIVAPRAGEMIHAPTLAARLGMFTGRLAQVTTPYPTWSTAIQQAAGQFFQDTGGREARPAKR